MSGYSVDEVKYRDFNDRTAFMLNDPLKKKEKDEQATQAAFLAYNANPRGQVHNVTLSNGQPNSVMTT